MTLKSKINKIYDKIVGNQNAVDPTITEIEKQLEEAEEMYSWHRKKMVHYENNINNFKRTIESLKQSKILIAKFGVPEKEDN